LFLANVDEHHKESKEKNSVESRLESIVYTRERERTKPLGVSKKLIYGVGEGRYAGEGMPQTAMQREQTTADVAEAVLFLTSDAAANITGQSLNVDGGMVKD
jgi:NAD(P)-dependent dehydrogenase (short-subunit alcohol dehydrogenase family)